MVDESPTMLECLIRDRKLTRGTYYALRSGSRKHLRSFVPAERAHAQRVLWALQPPLVEDFEGDLRRAQIAARCSMVKARRSFDELKSLCAQLSATSLATIEFSTSVHASEYFDWPELDAFDLEKDSKPAFPAFKQEHWSKPPPFAWVESTGFIVGAIIVSTAILVARILGFL